MELFAVGAENDRRSAEEALRANRPLDALTHAKKLLERVPDSTIGFALAAEAAESAWLDDEAAAALYRLTAMLPWRGELWVRLGRALASTDAVASRSAYERAAANVEDAAARRLAAFALCDLDLESGEPARALAWLDRVFVRLDAKDEPLLIRKAECLVELGQTAEAARAVESLGAEVGSDKRTPESERMVGRRALLFGRLMWSLADMSNPLKRAEALVHVERAYILEVPGATTLFGSVLSTTRDAKELLLMRSLVAMNGETEKFAVQIAIAEGREGDVRDRLLDAARRGDESAKASLRALAVRTRDEEALAAGRAAARGDDRLLAALRAEHDGAVEVVADLVASLPRASDLAPWALEVLTRAFTTWTGASTVDWRALAAWLVREAKQLSDDEAVRDLERLNLDPDRPITVAVLGEFNAGKSSFINAFVGANVAPTGILPTTATIHRVAFAPDAFARIALRGAPDRTIPHERLRETLKSLEDGPVPIDSVQIYAPIERLKWTEILDTPGFNSSNEEHDASARRALREAHAVIWLADATSPMKASEVDILREIREEGLPVLLLVNKIDRLGDGALATVLDHLRAAMTETDLSLLSGPHPFSAKRALEGRLGNAEALAASNWQEVESAVTTQLVDSANELREASHRRRIARIVERMTARARDLELQDDGAREATHAHAARLRGIAAECELGAAKLLVAMRSDLASDLALLEAAQKPLVTLTGEVVDDAGVRSYVAERLESHLATPCIEWLKRHFACDDVPAAIPLANAYLGGVSFGAPALPIVTNPRDVDRLIACTIRAFSIATDLLGQELLARGEAPRRALRLEAFASALSGKRANPSPAA